MAIEELSRGEELRGLGWSAEDVKRYEELWEYRHRWGAINLEREDRLFLRRAEAALPKRATGGRGGQKKSIREKSHYRWLASHLEAMRESEAERSLGEGERGAWPILLEEELEALEHYQPVLGLPDTLKAAAFTPMRERWAGEAATLGRTLSFDFAATLEDLRQQGNIRWKPLRADGCADPTAYPVLPAGEVEAFRERVRRELMALMPTVFPSLQDQASGSGETAPDKTAAFGGGEEEGGEED